MTAIRLTRWQIERGERLIQQEQLQFWDSTRACLTFCASRVLIAILPIAARAA
jgi:hypothetical protein